jgi:putative MATE family efflux protein
LLGQQAGDRRRAGLLSKQALVGGALLAVPISVFGTLLAGPSIHLFGVSAAVAQSGIVYTQITMGTSLTLIVSLVAGALLRGAGDTRTPMLVTLLSNVINGLVAYGLIFGQFGLPTLGVAGSAWGAVIGRSVGALLLLALLLRGRGPLSIGGRWGWRPRPRLWREVLALGLPASTEQILMTIGFMALTAVVAHLGTAALAAQRLAINVMMLSLMPGFGCSVAATTLVGQSVGANNVREGATAAGVAARLSVVWMSALGVVFAVFSSPLMHIFTSDPRVAALGAGCLLAIAMAQPFWAINDVLAGALRGAGHTGYPMLVNVATFWLAVTLAFVGVQFGGTLLWTWLAFTLVTPFGAGATAWRFYRWVQKSEARGPADRDLHCVECARAA